MPPATSGQRAALDPDTTHVLHFGHYCGASRWERFRGDGLWVLLAAGAYADGARHDALDDWSADGSKDASVRRLARWVSGLVGYPVTLTRSDRIIDPEWSSIVAYQVRRA